MSPDTTTSTVSGRKFGIGAFIGAVVVYIVILQGVPWLVTTGDIEYASWPDAENLLLTLVLQVGISVILVAALITWLGWWQRVIHESKRVRRWVWIVPILMLLGAVAATDWGHITSVSLSLSLSLVLGALLVGAGEELMFRGVGVEVFRRQGMTEARVALWSSVVFGLVHLTNLFTEGFGAVGQVFVTAFAGYLFYLTRRISGGILIPILLHAVWDYALFSGNVGPDPGLYAAAGISSAVLIALAITLTIRRRKIEPADEADDTAVSQPAPA